ncbi:MAG: Uma2 family endonuclease [Isosphaeraceae bacterium]
MSTDTQTVIPTAPPAGPPPANASGVVPYRLTVRQYLKMIDTGIFRDEDHVELLGGLLVDKMTKKDPHNFAIDMLGAILDQDLAPNWIARQEKSVVLGRFWRPEPDIAVARGPRDRYRARAPGPGDLAVLIEVADTSYSIDRGKKWQKYGSSRIPAYWIVNLPQRQIEVYTVPSGRGKSAGYRDVTIYGEDDEVPLVIEGRELGRIKVRDLLPVITES